LACIRSALSNIADSLLRQHAGWLAGRDSTIGYFHPRIFKQGELPRYDACMNRTKLQWAFAIKLRLFESRDLVQKQIPAAIAGVRCCQTLGEPLPFGNCSAFNYKERKDHKEGQKASNLCALCDFFVVFVMKSRMA
jgi:hypothetical protein